MAESVGSNSPTVNDPTQHITDRIIRALSHHLALLHRSDPHFYVLGSTANVYTVTISTSPNCTCPDRTTPCKHILFVLLRVLSLPFDEPSLYRGKMRPCQLSRMLSLPSAPDAMANGRAIARFHQVFVERNSRMENVGGGEKEEEDEGEVCPICLDELKGSGDGESKNGKATCSKCGNSVHGECLGRWKRSRGRRGVSCVVCRARWRERREVEERYLNLGAYVDDREEGGRGWGLCER